MALTQGPSALRSRVLRIIAWETRESPHTDNYVTWSSASAHRLLCDLKFCSSTSTHGLFFGLKFRLRIRNILRLKVPQFRFRIQNSVWLGTLKWRNSASARGKYCGLEVMQLCFHTINLVRLEVSHPYKSFDFKSRSSASAQRISCDLKFRSFASAQGIYYVSKLSSSAFANRQSVIWSSSVSHNKLWLEFPLPQKRRHLKFRSSASAREHYFSLENPLSFNLPPIS